MVLALVDLLEQRIYRLLYSDQLTMVAVSPSLVDSFLLFVWRLRFQHLQLQADRRWLLKRLKGSTRHWKPSIMPCIERQPSATVIWRLTSCQLRFNHRNNLWLIHLKFQNHVPFWQLVIHYVSHLYSISSPHHSMISLSLTMTSWVHLRISTSTSAASTDYWQHY